MADKKAQAIRHKPALLEQEIMEEQLVAIGNTPELVAKFTEAVHSILPHFKSLA